MHVDLPASYYIQQTNTIKVRVYIRRPDTFLDFATVKSLIMVVGLIKSISRRMSDSMLIMARLISLS